MEEYLKRWNCYLEKKNNERILEAIRKVKFVGDKFDEPRGLKPMEPQPEVRRKARQL